MSYSRWTNSRFYTYWCTDEYADCQQLMIDAGNTHARVSYELCKLFDEKVAELFARDAAEKQELLNIIARFIEDVEARR